MQTGYILNTEESWCEWLISIQTTFLRFGCTKNKSGFDANIQKCSNTFSDCSHYLIMDCTMGSPSSCSHIWTVTCLEQIFRSSFRTLWNIDIYNYRKQYSPERIMGEKFVPVIIFQKMYQQPNFWKHRKLSPSSTFPIMYDQSSFFISEAAMEIFAAIICSKKTVSTYGWNALFVYLADEACSPGSAGGLS